MSEPRKAFSCGPWYVEELFGPDEHGSALFDVRHANGALSFTLPFEELRDLMVAAISILGVEQVGPADE